MATSSLKSFLFLEIHDPDFNAFYDEFTWTVTGSRPTKPPHLTVRGPYRHRIPDNELERCRETMRHAVLKISGAGRFSNPGEEAVYLNVDSWQLREIWWKPDYPIRKWGFNPHISLYRGRDSALADRLAAFAPLRSLTFLCAEYKLVPFVKTREASRELGLRTFQRSRDHQRLEANGSIPGDFFSQLRKLVNNEPLSKNPQLHMFEF